METQCCVQKAFARERLLLVAAVEQRTDGQRNLLLLVVDVDNLSFDFLTDGQCFLSLCDAMVGNLGNVNQAVNARNDFSKCTEGHKLENLNGCGVAYL